MLRDTETTSEEYSIRTDGGEGLSEVIEEYREQVIESERAVYDEINSMSDAELREYLNRSGGDGR